MAAADQQVTALRAASRRNDVTGAGSTQESTTCYRRSPEDMLRALIFLSAALVLLSIRLGVKNVVTGLEEDVVAHFEFLSSSATRVIDGGIEVVGIVATLLIYAVAIRTKRYRLLGYAVAASVSSFSLMTLVSALVDRQSPSNLANEIAERAGVDTGVTAGVAGIAQLSALFIVTAPFVSRRWRRAGMIVVAFVTFGRLLVASELPVELFVALPVGAVCGATVLLVFGRPDRRPTLEAIGEALRSAGIAVTEVHQANVDARGSTPYVATSSDGSRLFVKVLGADERAADLLFRTYRFFRLKDVGDTRPFLSLRRTVEHEALVALMARDAGVRTPRLRTVVDVGADSMLLAYEMIAGESLDRVTDGAISNELLGAMWSQVEMLREHRIAHRDLRLANIFVGDDGVPWIIDFGFSEVAEPDEVLDADVVQLLVSVAVEIGADRAVTSAVAALGPEVVGESLPRLQLAALSGATKSAMKRHKGLLKELQQTVVDRTDVDHVELVEIQRVTKRTLFTIVTLAAVTYFLLPQFADLPGIINRVGAANWAWTPLILIGSATTYIGAAISLSGSVPKRVQPGPMILASVGSSFASKLAPAGIGGAAVNVRFLQKQGVDEPVAVSAIGLNTIGGLLGHVSLIGVFIVWAGRDAFASFSLPNPRWFIVALGVAAAALAVTLIIPAGRHIFTRRLYPVLRRMTDGASEVLHRPGKVTMLLGGSVLVTFAYLTTLYFSVAAFGGGLPFATVGAVYLVGAAVAQAAPTPGGLGAVEAALIAGLVAAGLDNTVAVPAVFMYRLFTFWAPILPGWLSFQWLERHDYL